MFWDRMIGIKDAISEGFSRVGQQAMETAQHRDRSAKNQPAEIAMFQISEVQESPAFNDRRSFLTLRAEITMFQISEVQESPAFNGGRSFLTLRVSITRWRPPQAIGTHAPTSDFSITFGEVDSEQDFPDFRCV
jgi:hypothetical protein